MARWFDLHGPLTATALATALGVAFLACGGDDEGNKAEFGDGSGTSTGSTTGTATGTIIGTSTGAATGTATGGPVNQEETCDGVLKGVVRDFHESHPDMEMFGRDNHGAYSFEQGIVAPTIGPDRKPVYAGGAGKMTTGADNFNQWFRDVEGVNVSFQLPLKFEDPDGDGVFTFDNNGMDFFPADGLGFNEWTGEHNYHFTFELHTSFTYEGGEVFKFTGDDDVFVFIAGQLVVDLGGVHQTMEGQVAVDTLGLTPGQQYDLDFFFAERHVTESNFRIDTTLKFIDCGVIIQ